MRLWANTVIFVPSAPKMLIFAPLRQLKRRSIQIKKYIFSLNLVQIQKLSGIWLDTYIELPDKSRVLDIGEE